MRPSMRLIVTGAAGFIGQAFCRLAIESGAMIHGIDKLTYAANPITVQELQQLQNFTLHCADICDLRAIQNLIGQVKPDAIIHLAAETHVDRSIDTPAAFIQTNVNGTYNLLEAAHGYYHALSTTQRDTFRFLHISTDEVYGATAEGAEGFTEDSPMRPTSPYAASKASAELLAQTWHLTYGLPVIITSCSNNYGAYQFPEKLIPHMINRALQNKSLPPYGNGLQRRDWLHSTDHAAALWTVLIKGAVGQKYNIAGRNELTNLELVQMLCAMLDEFAPHSKPYAQLVTHVADRPAHDRRYAINDSLIRNTLGWIPNISIAEGLRETVAWYCTRQDWLAESATLYDGGRLGLRIAKQAV